MLSLKIKYHLFLFSYKISNRIFKPLFKEVLFSKYKKIQAAYLFGSYAEGKENKFSDIDIGIVLNEVYVKSMKVEILKDLEDILKSFGQLL